MKLSEFSLHQRFICCGREWFVTDVGTRVIVAIAVKPNWMAGPPYALAETVFDEEDMLGCSPVTLT